jgi:hypothetical protein
MEVSGQMQVMKIIPLNDTLWPQKERNAYLSEKSEYMYMGQGDSSEQVSDAAHGLLVFLFNSCKIIHCFLVQINLFIC